MTGDRLHDAQSKAAEAVGELDRVELVATLCEQDALFMASLTHDRLGPMLVTYQRKPLGEVHTESPGGFQDWYARLYEEDGSLSASDGPYVTARAAAASMIPHRGLSQK